MLVEIHFLLLSQVSTKKGHTTNLFILFPFFLKINFLFRFSRCFGGAEDEFHSVIEPRKAFRMCCACISLLYMASLGCHHHSSHNIPIGNTLTSLSAFASYSRWLDIFLYIQQILPFNVVFLFLSLLFFLLLSLVKFFYISIFCMFSPLYEIESIVKFLFNWYFFFFLNFLLLRSRLIHNNARESMISLLKLIRGKYWIYNTWVEIE